MPALTYLWGTEIRRITRSSTKRGIRKLFRCFPANTITPPSFPNWRTGGADWRLRAMQDDPDSDSWNGENVFDVYTKSAGTGLDGTNYKDW
jgi:hypothetical protein